MGVLIGLRMEVADSANPSLRGLEGRVVDETMKTLVVETGPRWPSGFRALARETRRPTRRVVPKAACRFRFRLPDGRAVEIRGQDLVGRPQERVYIRAKA